ncbi:MAG TPA: hypothetical protein VFA09_24305 [Ktedonobacteraceae bacterium]|nr:hypothetical protein [Ktedonobacteraceae bacterium]
MKEANSDSYGFYQLWLKNLQEGQDQVLKATAQGMQNSREAWKQWLDATMSTWQKTAEMGTDPLGLTSQWLEMMEAIQEKLLAGGTVPSDPFTFLKEWYDAISESWSSIVERIIASEQFLEFNKQFLESYASFSRAFRRANEEYLRILQLPSRSDVSHVSELVVALEEKFDRLDERFEDVDAALAQTVKREAIEGIEHRLAAAESRLNQSIASVEGNVQQAGSQLTQAISSIEVYLKHIESQAATIAPELESRLATVEGKLDALQEQAGQFRAIQDLAQRLEQVEGKLDTILTKFSKLEAYEPDGHGEAKARAPHKPQRKKASQTEAAGQPAEAGS